MAANYSFRRLDKLGGILIGYGFGVRLALTLASAIALPLTSGRAQTTSLDLQNSNTPESLPVWTTLTFASQTNLGPSTSPRSTGRKNNSPSPPPLGRMEFKGWPQFHNRLPPSRLAWGDRLPLSTETFSRSNPARTRATRKALKSSTVNSSAPLRTNASGSKPTATSTLMTFSRSSCSLGQMLPAPRST